MIHWSIFLLLGLYSLVITLAYLSVELSKTKSVSLNNYFKIQMLVLNEWRDALHHGKYKQFKCLPEAEEALANMGQYPTDVLYRIVHVREELLSFSSKGMQYVQ